jgi:hypothetical protein
MTAPPTVTDTKDRGKLVRKNIAHRAASASSSTATTIATTSAAVCSEIRKGNVWKVAPRPSEVRS